MHVRALSVVALALLGCTTALHAGDSGWQPAGLPASASAAAPAAVSATPVVRIGRPLPPDALIPSGVQTVGFTDPAIIQIQAPGDPITGGIPPPPAFPGTAPGIPPPPPGGVDPLTCGTVNSNADLGGFWSQCGHKLSRCWDSFTGGVGSATQGVTQVFGSPNAFRSDHCFDGFISPVSNPFLFEDPRALTEVRPVFVFQHTPTANPIFRGGNNYFLDLQARVAFTNRLSLVINELGFTWTGIDNLQSGFASHFGFSELHIGPKYTFYRNENTNTVMAGGLNFIIPTGPAKVFQDTGSLSVAPYFSVAQSFLRSDYGTFNFMNTDGYSLGDRRRTDFFYASFHLDYNVYNAGVFYPLVELNWTHYTANGAARPFTFEGSNLFNFGSTSVAGREDLTLALGARYKVNQNLQFGVAPEFTLLGNRNGNHLDKFRLTVDMIYRY